MTQRRTVAAGFLVAAFALPSLVGAPDAKAYDPDYTHRWIAWQSVDHLIRLFPGEMALLNEWKEALVDGVEAEDDLFLDGDDDPTTVRLMRHFYNPITKEGLSMPAFGDFPNSYQWGAEANEQNIWGYDDALRAYQAGDYEEAFFALGHVVHLIQDATVPAHTHLDDHGPPYGDFYEDWCTDQMRSQFESDLPLPPFDADVPIFDSPEHAWQATAQASYWRNMVPGMLSTVELEQATGPLADMFPDIEVDLTGDWSIPGIGELDAAFWEEQPGYFYLKKLGRAGAVDRTHFDPRSPMMFEYGLTDDDLAANIARDMIPMAVLNGAGVIKMFLEEAEALGPPSKTPGMPDQPLPDEGGCSAAGGSGASSAFAFALLACLSFLRRRTVKP